MEIIPIIGGAVIVYGAICILGLCGWMLYDKAWSCIDPGGYALAQHKRETHAFEANARDAWWRDSNERAKRALVAALAAGKTEAEAKQRARDAWAAPFPGAAAALRERYQRQKGHKL